MSPCNVLRFFLLSLTIMPSVLIAIHPPSQSSSCHPDQRDALSRFKHSFSISPLFYLEYICVGTSSPKTASWREDEDCCSWEGVTCDHSTGDVVGLDLSCAWLQGTIDSNSSMFSLPHLRSLSLAGNNLSGSSILAKISVFSQMTHLNLSSTGLIGIVPTEISHLSKLVSLDLSLNWLVMQNPTMRMLVRNLTQLEELDLSYNNMSMVIPTSLMNFSSSVISLRLSVCSLGGRFPEYIIQLPNLQMLNLYWNRDLHGILPESNWTSSLAFLSLGGCSFTGEVPHSIGNLTRLTSLDLSYCSLGGRFPEYIIQLPNLQMLDLSWNRGLHGILPESNWSSSLAFLSLWECSFTGEVPRSIGTLNLLTYLDLSWNKFTGVVDLHAFSAYKNLRFLGLSGMPISGEDATEANPNFPKLEMLLIWGGMLINFPCFLSGMPELRELSLSGSIISEFPGQCINSGLSFPLFQRVEMNSCNLTKFPSFLSHSNKLRFLNLQGNMIEEIPSWFWGIGTDTLEELHLADNLLKGGLRLPWKRLEVLDVENNSFEGPLPIPTSPSIREFRGTSNHFNGSIPLSMCHLTSLKILALGQNNLTGVIIPPCFGNLTMLMTLDLSNNSLMGPLPLPSYATKYYSVSKNNFSGEISSLICNATNLVLLDLSSNGITGTLPQCLENITISLGCLNLRMNKFHGSIPEIFPKESKLKSLDFSGNQFNGSLPRSLSNCQILEVLDVGSNKIVDSFPDWLGDLPLKVLSLRSNKFRSHLSVSQGIRLFSELRILDLSNNGFEGNLSDNFISEMFGMVRGHGDSATRYMTGQGSFAYYSVMINLKGEETEMVKIYIDFATLDLSSNHFGGEIPKNIGLLKSLKGLNFSHNSFTGTIPPSVGNLTNLESLDLSSNHLVGGIPKELVKLTFLGALNLSWNNLTGPIPSGGHFNTFTDSFEGNPELCGIPLRRVCGQGRAEAQPLPDQRDNGKDELGGWFEWTFVAMGFGCGLGIGISLGYMALEMGRPLWLARMVIRLEGSCRKRSKRKAPRRNSRT